MAATYLACARAIAVSATAVLTASRELSYLARLAEACGRTKYTDVATQHRIYGVLRAFLNYQWKRARKITFNPVYAVELEPELRAAPLGVRSQGQASVSSAWTRAASLS
jgi:hypothetical protein